MATSNKNKPSGNNQQSKKLTPAKSDKQVDPVIDTKANSAGTLEQDGKADLTANQGETSSDAKKEKTGKIPGLLVQSKQAGFRRAGRSWATEPTFVALDELTEEQITALEEEPLLVVTRTKD